MPVSGQRPGLLASFICIIDGEQLTLDPLATSQMFYVIRGSVTARQRSYEISFDAGSFLTLPGGTTSTLTADDAVALYYMTDGRLLAFLGATGITPRFEPTLYPSVRAALKLRKVANDGHAAIRSRISVLLANENFPPTRHCSPLMATGMNLNNERACGVTINRG